MEWFRWYHGAISDPKWPLIARRSGQSIGIVVSIWASLLEHASQEQSRGSIEGFNPEAIDALYGYEDETTVTVCNAMRNAGIINAENFICSWEKRQPKRERDDDSSERVRRFREKQKANKNNDLAHRNDSETGSNANVTPSNAQNRTEQNREDSKEEPPISPKGDGGDENPPSETPKKKRAPKMQSPFRYSEEFEAAWKAYPRRERKGAAWAAWEKAIKREMPVEKMVGIIAARKSMHDWKKDGGQFAPHMASWLNQNGWEDEISGYAGEYDSQFAGVI